MNYFSRKSRTILLAAGLMVSVVLGSHSTINASARLLDFHGDARFREEFSNQTGTADRWRSRARFRLGSQVDFSEDTKIIFGFATGSANPRSTNASFTGAFSTLPVGIDYIYLDQTLVPGLTLLMGKMKNPIIRSSGLLFDSDIRPDGIFISGEQSLDSLKGMLSGGVFLLNELSGTASDPIMFVIQPAVTAKMGDIHSTFSAAYFHFANVRGMPRILYPGESATNLTNGNTVAGPDSDLVFDYNTLALSAKIELPGMAEIVPYVALIGDFVYNPDSDDTGGLVGFKVGNKKVKNFGDWQTVFNWRYLHADAWLDIFPNSSAFKGATNVHGFNISQTVGLAKNVSLKASAYIMDTINGPDINRNVYQFNVNFKL